MQTHSGCQELNKCDAKINRESCTNVCRKQNLFHKTLKTIRKGKFEFLIQLLNKEYIISKLERHSERELRDAIIYGLVASNIIEELKIYIAEDNIEHRKSYTVQEVRELIRKLKGG